MQSLPLPPLGSHIPFPNTNETAILKYVGSVDGHEGVFCGLELCGELSSRGKNSGEVNNTRYFTVSVANSGLFVPLRKVVSWLSQTGVDHNVSGGVDEVTELKKYIAVLESRITLRENDIREMHGHVDELDANIRANEERLSRKEAKFENFKREKDSEIELLVSTIETLERKLQNDRVKELEEMLENERRLFQEYKIAKEEEINRLTAHSYVDINQAYQPPQPIDSSAGRPNFCTYCDRDGHTTDDCPYEKDNLEMF